MREDRLSVLMSFCGAAGTVTGSCHWVRNGRSQFIVDCGLFQGAKTIKELNYGSFPFDPKALDFVLLTHSHIDHAGLLPKLYAHGFRGPIYATAQTADLLSFMLPDSGHIQEFEVERLNRRNARRGLPEVTPIYTRADAEACLELFHPVRYGDWVEVGEGVRARFWNAGHILGSASIEVESATGRPDNRLLRVLFSGDIGPEHKLFHPSPDAADNLDYILCESTYGGRERPRVTAEERREIFASEVETALARGGNLLIPGFAVERTQELLLDLAIAFDQKRLREVPVFIDSPLAIRATEVFSKYASELVGAEGVANPFKRPNVRFTETAQESMGIERVRGGAIIISASGMCDAGRIRHHLQNHLWRPESTVLFVGYQAQGTLGRILVEGARTVRIQGEEIRVAAAIRRIDVYSGHADGSELLQWLKARLPVKRAVFLVHGETEGLEAMRDGLLAEGLDRERVIIPQLDDTVDLVEGGGIMERAMPRRMPVEDVAGPDSHNEFARFSIELKQMLRKTPNEKARRALLNRLQRALGRVA